MLTHEWTTEPKAAFEAFGNNVVLVNRFPDRMLVSEESIRHGRPEFVRLSGRRLFIQCANGSATYRLHVRWRFGPLRTYGAVKVSTC